MHMHAFFMLPNNVLLGNTVPISAVSNSTEVLVNLEGNFTINIPSGQWFCFSYRFFFPKEHDISVGEQV